MSGDVQVRICEHLRGRFSRVTRLVCHCRSKEEGEALLNDLQERLAECKLQLHPVKTRLVYCKDGKRRGEYPDTCFDFF